MDTHFMELIGVILVAVITSIIGPSVVMVVRNRITKGKPKVDPIRQEIEHSKVINDEIEEIRELLKADRVWIQMYHNGGHFLITTKSIQKFSVMFESTKPGVERIGHIFTNLPVSLYSRATEQLLTNKHIYIEDFSDPQIATFGLKNAGETTGTKSAYTIALFDIITDQCIGSIGLDYTKKKKLKTEELSLFNERSNRVAGYLSNFLK